MKIAGGPPGDISTDGKVVLFYLKSPPEAFVGGIPMFSPKPVEILGRQFLFGESPPSLNDWTSGLKIGIAIDHIAHFLIFENIDDFTQRTPPLEGYGQSN